MDYGYRFNRRGGYWVTGRRRWPWVAVALLALAAVACVRF